MADSEGEARSQTVIHCLIGRACLLAVRPRCDEIKKQAGAVWAAEVPTSAHAVLGRHDFSVLPREQFGVLGKLPTFLWCSACFQ